MLQLAVLLFITASSAQSADEPDIKLEAFDPKGFKVTLKDYGFSLLTFYGNINEEINDQEDTDWARNVTKDMDGKWTFKDRNAKLNIGDKIYYSVNLVKDGQEYRQAQREWTVTEYAVQKSEVILPPLPPPHKPVYDIQPPDSNAEPPAYNTQPPVGGASAYPAYDSQPANLTDDQDFWPPCKGRLIFNEEFDKMSFEDLTNWEVERRKPQETDNSSNVYIPKYTITLESGALVIKPVLTEKVYSEEYEKEGNLDLNNRCIEKFNTLECNRKTDNAKSPVTGKISTKHKFAFKHGILEIRAKVPLVAGQWLTPNFNFEPLDSVHGTRRNESGMMKKMFASGSENDAKKQYAAQSPEFADEDPNISMNSKEPYTTESTEYYDEEPPILNSELQMALEKWNKDFHNYTLIWRPDALRIFLDGELFSVAVPEGEIHASGHEHLAPLKSTWLRGNILAPLEELFYISLDLRMQGDFLNDKDIPKPWESQSGYDEVLKIDSVKVYTHC